MKNPFKLSTRHLFALGGISLLALCYKIFSFSTHPAKEDSIYQDYFNSNYKVFSLKVPQNLTFAGETVPIRDFSVMEALDRELLINTYWQSQTLLLHKRANRWFPLIEPVLKKNGVPDDFKFLALVESGLTNIVSPMKATGFWQIIESTAKIYGLEKTDEIDERYHVEKSTEAACSYFLDAYQRFHNWTLVAASYNLGMGGIEGQLKKQKVGSYYDLALNEETSRYIFRILATKEIITHPKTYGFILRKKDLYPILPTYKVKVDSSISNLADFAIHLGVNYKILKIFNPWLRKNSLTNSEKKLYSIDLPKPGVNPYELIDYYDSDSNLLVSDSGLIFSRKPSKPDSSSHSEITHLVKSGETIAILSKKYNVSTELIRMWNLIPENEEPRINQELVIFISVKK